MQWETAAGGEWQQGETENLRSYVCKSCGGEIVGDENTAATACPFCGNPVVMMGQFAGALRPDYVIPFKLDKKAAKAALMKHYGSKRLLPKAFKDQNHIDEVKGVYVPFWLFDADVDAHVRYKVGICSYITRWIAGKSRNREAAPAVPPPTHPPPGKPTAEAAESSNETKHSEDDCI